MAIYIEDKAGNRKRVAGFGGVKLLSGTIPAGGTTGQALVKVSDTDNDIAWGDVIGYGGSGSAADFSFYIDDEGYLIMEYAEDATATSVTTLASTAYKLATTANTTANRLADFVNAYGSTAAYANSANGTAVGYGSNASGEGSVALGTSSIASGAGAVALGMRSTASDVYSTAVGVFACATSSPSTAVGLYSNAIGAFSASFGALTNAIGYSSIAIGSAVNVYGNHSVALGGDIDITGEYSVAIGKGAQVTSNSTVAIGRNVFANGTSSIAIGNNATAGDGYNDCIAIGYNATSVGSHSEAFGISSYATGIDSLAIGLLSSATGDYSTAVGFSSQTSNTNSIQLGNASSLSSITAKVSITVTSDKRDKADIEPIADGATDFLRRVKAVTFVYNQRELYRPKEPDEDDEGNPIIEDGVDYLTDEDRENISKYGFCRYDTEAHDAGTKKGTRRRVGVLAQETQEALKEVYGDSSYANLVNDNLYDFESVPDGIESTLAMNYEGFIPFLIKAFQEMDERITDHDTRIAALEGG